MAALGQSRGLAVAYLSTEEINIIKSLGLWAMIQNFLIAFSPSYMAERRFSAVANLLSKKRSRLQITERGDLGIMLTKMEPDINKFLKLHQPQLSR